MGQTIIYKCDRCKKESTNINELKLQVVGIGIKSIGYSSYTANTLLLYDMQRRQMDMCENCLSELGIRKKENEIEVPEKTYPSIEDIIREIVRDEINSQ